MKFISHKFYYSIAVILMDIGQDYSLFRIIANFSQKLKSLKGQIKVQHKALRDSTDEEFQEYLAFYGSKKD